MVVQNQGATSSAGASAASSAAGGPGESAATGRSALGELTEAQVMSLFLAPEGAPGGQSANEGSSAAAEVVEETETEAVEVEVTETEEAAEAEETETEAEAEAEAGAGGPLEEGLLKALPGDQHKGLRKRLTKVFAEHKALKSELETVKAQATAAQAAPVVLQGAATPLADVGTLEALADMEASASAWLEWCEENTEGGTPPVKDAAEMTKDEVRQRRVEAQRTLRLIPARRTYLEQYTTAHAAVVKAHPDLLKPDSALHKQAMETLKAVPGLVTSPTYLQDVLDLLEGRRIREEKAAGTTHVRVAAAPKTGAAKTAAAPVVKKAVTGAAAPVRTAPAGVSHGQPDWKQAVSRAERGDVKAQALVAQAFLEPAV